MGRMKKPKKVESNKTRHPALSPEARENQLIALSMDLAEQQLREGTASSQVITHYLKLGSIKDKLEREKLENENKLLKEKVESLKASRKSEEMYQKVLDSLRVYQGSEK